MGSPGTGRVGTRSRRGLPAAASLAASVIAGVALGGLAIAVDQMSIRLLVVVFSSGLSWGAAAVAIGALSRDRAVAAAAGALAPTAAVLTYYVGIRLLSLRDAGAGLAGAVQVWGALALVGGAVAGLAGWHARFGGRREAPIAWGLLTGLLLGQGVGWAWRYGLSPDVVFTTSLVVPMAILAWGVRRGGAAYAIPTMLVSAVASAWLWSIVQTRL